MLENNSLPEKKKWLKKCLFFFLSLIFVINIHAQTPVTITTNPDLKIEQQSLTSMMKDNTFAINFCWESWSHLYSAYYIYGFEYPKDIESFIRCGEDNFGKQDIYINLLKNFQDRLVLRTDDSTVSILYNSDTLTTIIRETTTCQSISSDDNTRIYVQFFDNNGMPQSNNDYYASFNKMRASIYKKFIKKGYVSETFPKDSCNVASGRAVIILYQYTPMEGLTVNKVGSCDYKVLDNDYTKSLEKLAARYCKKYKISRILFAGRVMSEKD